MEIFNILAALALLFGAGYLGWRIGRGASKEAIKEGTTRREFDMSLLKAKLIKIAELSTVELQYTEIVCETKQKHLFNIDLPFTTSTLTLEYCGKLKAGVDLSEANIRNIDKEIRLQLPPARILSHEIDPSSIRVLNQNNGLFSKIDITDFIGFCSEHKALVEQRAELVQPLLNTAAEKLPEALSLVGEVLEHSGYQLTITASKTTADNRLPQLDSKDPSAPLTQPAATNHTE